MVEADWGHRDARDERIAALEQQLQALLLAHERLQRQCEGLTQALETRDLIGQAKGIIMSATGCSPEAAFKVMAVQSQHENRKLVDVAADIQRRAQAPRRDTALDKPT